MTRAEFDAMLDVLDWSYRSLARRLRVHETRIRSWARRPDLIPPAVASWLAERAADINAAPVPPGWPSQPRK